MWSQTWQFLDKLTSNFCKEQTYVTTVAFAPLEKKLALSSPLSEKIWASP
jgi:hypothetical protein